MAGDSGRAVTARMAALLALFDLGGSVRPVGTEDVAMRAAQVAPRAFRWKRYPEQVHLEAVRLALKAGKEHSPPLAVGTVRQGWQLTPEGVQACESVRGTPPALLQEETRRVSHSPAFRTWQGRGAVAVTKTELLDLLRVDEYFPEARRRERVIALLNAVRGNPELESFAAEMRERYPEVMKL